MKPLGKFCVEIISGTVELDHFHVMTRIVKLGDVEMGANAEANQGYSGNGKKYTGSIFLLRPV
jgi:hypothetical protein